MNFQQFRQVFRCSLTVTPMVLSALFSLLLVVSSAQAEFGSIVDFGLAGDFYFTDSDANNGQGYINLLMQNNWEDSQIWVDLGAGGLVGEATASSYIKAPQLYYRYGVEGESVFVIGRHLHNWSALDQQWNMGLTQPIFVWDQARPEQQGLTGLFLTTPVIEKNLELTLFASPIFLPSQGPSFELINGKLTSSNPWFAVPVDQLREQNGNVLDLNFDLEIPKTSDVLFNPSYAIQLASPRTKKGLIYNSFVMDKPRNDLVLPFSGGKNGSTLNGDILVQPLVARHQVGGVDIGWESPFFKTTFSWLHESEVEYSAPEGTTFPILPEQNIFSLVQLFRLSQSQRLSIGYIHVDGQDVAVGGSLQGEEGLDAYSSRNRFEKVLRVKWEGLLFKSMGRYRVNASFAYNQSLIRDNVWLSSNFRWSVYRGFETFWQCDFFGGSEAQVKAVDFISTFQNNDRCLVGGHYAF